ncbi:FeoC-like transcriptional regulator [Vibrio sp. HN007]|uniref:FeoC-like transcriptional regulator n=1 Tax=Vibrio iocasae TaxID=3098914 RepID=UPI0035D50CF3
MIVSQLKEYIEEHGSASRSAMAKHFSLSEDGVEAMLEIWAKKGKISKAVDTDKQGNITEIRYRIIDSLTIPTDTRFR